MPAAADTPDNTDIAELAKGGRTNFLGFLLRLAARLPFLFIAGRVYGADALGRFAYAVIVVEFAAQLATFGLKRGLAQQLARTSRPQAHVMWDAMLLGGLAAAATVVFLCLLPQVMFPNSELNPLDWLLPLTVFGLVWSDIALAALAYRLDIAATVKARSIVEPWTISIAAFALQWYSLRDGLILSYVLSIIAAFVASVVPLLRSYGRPERWTPEPQRLAALARRNLPLAAADGIEWGSRRLDIAILGLLFPPAIVGIYYVAQQVASLPQKLKTSFDPILGPVITQKLAEGDRPAVARQVRQVGFWIIAAQAAIALALGLPGEAVMGLVGPNFVGGTGALAFLLLAEVVAATAVVAEAALIYVARKRNLMISVMMIAVQVVLSFAVVRGMRLMDGMDLTIGDTVYRLTVPILWQAAGPAFAMTCALGIASILKARLLSRLLGAPVSGWRWVLIWAAAPAVVVGSLVALLPEWLELSLGIPAILAAYGALIWFKGFGSEDRALFRRT